jgi:hypothetical protein
MSAHGRTAIPTRYPRICEVRKSPRQRVCELRRLAAWAASLLVMLSGMAIKTYYTTLQTADAVQDIRAEMKAQRADMARLLRNDAMQDQRANDAEQDRDRMRARLQRIEDRVGKA